MHINTRNYPIGYAIHIGLHWAEKEEAHKKTKYIGTKRAEAKATKQSIISKISIICVNFDIPLSDCARSFANWRKGFRTTRKYHKKGLNLQEQTK